jgi:hypothetical protein
MRHPRDRGPRARYIAQSLTAIGCSSGDGRARELVIAPPTPSGNQHERNDRQVTRILRMFSALKSPTRERKT